MVLLAGADNDWAFVQEMFGKKLDAGLFSQKLAGMQGGSPNTKHMKYLNVRHPFLDSATPLLRQHPFYWPFPSRP